MSISAVRLYHLVTALPETIGNALVFFQSRETLLVEVVDRSGVSGWGETWALPHAAAAVIESRLAHRLLDQDAMQVGRLWHDMCAATGGEGVSRMAIAALDMALHDLAARLMGVPLATVLGGALRQRVPAYASGPFFKPGGHPYRDFEREAAGYLEAGFKAIKLRSGLHPREDAAIAAKVRRLMGEDGTLMVDFNQAYSPRAALDASLRMADSRPLWIEEPTTPEDIDGYRLLAGRVETSLAGGETYGEARAFLPFLSTGSMDVLQPDIAICGGLSGVSRVAALAELYARPVIPHVWGSSVNLYAALHFAAAQPAMPAGAAAPMPYLEYDMGPHPLFDALGRPPVNADGTVSLPDGPGLGITPSPAAFAPLVGTSREITP
ncbi:mandelate racemase/muconate lactonizing enzyme family protein [Ancylobacter sp. Lp-2]|uniref:mandelate racemase/muconate lactonizing enzyme family protein n=1 Tax=Ancylobacter sp. Lp-2 TaxID=2881339 RepID=UPI001E3BD295|nr:mandelate racemase/muconate lactonizing enzyme family protein [Ancylobacter sp. Lp-2]MCB4770358.1 mandelate racemase/muconate lactonizing enzyme family protein [Ancylobacter sp. Lp-2]